jgi:hypothetical protein
MWANIFILFFLIRILFNEEFFNIDFSIYSNFAKIFAGQIYFVNRNDMIHESNCPQNDYAKLTSIIIIQNWNGVKLGWSPYLFR